MASDVVTPTRGHLPVMPDEVLALLSVRPGMTVVDCTAGGGGHLARLALAVGPTGRVLATDRDPRAHRDDAAGGVAKQFPAIVTLFHRPFSEIEGVLADAKVARVDAVFADLGVSSFQLDEGARGFSFRADAPLDMRMDTSKGETAAELIARVDEEELANLIFAFGEERKSRRVARVLKRVLPTTTGEAARLVAGAVAEGHSRIHPATRTFQALRIAVNGELDQLDALLASLPNVLHEGGTAAILSFHSLEDRRVKNAFKQPGYRLLTKRPTTASEDECARNPRSRSAKLRAAVRDQHAKQGHVSKYARDDDDDVMDDADDPSHDALNERGGRT
jgi:16S rRNA (cytosine1402-N4)-methyltransferase